MGLNAGYHRIHSIGRHLWPSVRPVFGSTTQYFIVYGTRTYIRVPVLQVLRVSIEVACTQSAYRTSSSFRSQGWDFLPCRFWLGMWTAVMILALVAVDASFLVAYITRFTEEAFATLISIIFIVESFLAMSKLRYPKAPITEHFVNEIDLNGTNASLATQAPMVRVRSEFS